MTFMETNVEELLRNLYHCIHTCMYTIIYGYARVGITCIGSICLRIYFAHHGFTNVYLHLNNISSESSLPHKLVT